jgi:hypothetical protein
MAENASVSMAGQFYLERTARLGITRRDHATGLGQELYETENESLPRLKDMAAVDHSRCPN